MFSCNLTILFIRQRKEGRSVAQHACVVQLCSGISVPCCCSCACSSHSFRWCIALDYFNHTVPPPPTYVRILGHTFHSRICPRSEGNLCSLEGGGSNVNPHLHKLGAIPLSVVVCSLYRISLSYRRQSEPNLGDLRLCSNMWISYCCLIGEMRHH